MNSSYLKVRRLHFILQISKETPYKKKIVQNNRIDYISIPESGLKIYYMYYHFYVSIENKVFYDSQSVLQYTKVKKKNTVKIKKIIMKIL